jgi:16S rRNA (cytosine967-C5)-methyltransferase
VQRWVANFGKEETAKILQFAQEPPELCIRVCELSITPEGLQEILERNGLTLKKSMLARSSFRIERGRKLDDSEGDSSRRPQAQKPSRKSSKSFRGSPEKLPGYTEGLFSIQDEAAAFVCEIVDAKPGELIVDLCAAPGGKSIYLAECMENRGRVVAVDQSASRLSPLKEARTRLGLTNIEIVPHDGRTFKLPQLADRVLVDAPCMGTGVINRRPDLRFRRSEEDLPNLIELQRQLLANATTLVKPGGILVYATCSIEPEENFENAKWFLDNFEEFEPSDIASYLPEAILEECTPNSSGPACKTRIEDSCLHFVQLLPSRHGVSGFFIAKFRKRNDA